MGVYPSPPMQPKPPAFETAAARGPPEVLAMPASRMGCLMLRRVVRGVVRGPWAAIVAVLVETFERLGSRWFKRVRFGIGEREEHVDID